MSEIGHLYRNDLLGENECLLVISGPIADDFGVAWCFGVTSAPSIPYGAIVQGGDDPLPGSIIDASVIVTVPGTALGEDLGACSLATWQRVAAHLHLMLGI